MRRTLASNDPLSQQCIENNILDFKSLLSFIRRLPYGRLENRRDYLHTLDLLKGTCSSKHAFIKTICQCQGWDDIELILLLYNMNNKNTPGISAVLGKAGLNSIPEAHVILYDRCEKRFMDCTFPDSQNKDLIQDSILCECIEADQILNYKVKWHKDYIKQWSLSTPYTFQEIWEIRENCIKALTEKAY